MMGNSFLWTSKLYRACLGLLASIAAACVSPELQSAEALPIEIVADGNCPNLSDLYRERGISIRGQHSSPDAHLSWLVSGEKIRKAKTPLNTPPGPGKPSVYFAQTMRVTQPSLGKFVLEAFDHEGHSMGTFDFGPEDGWQCGGGSFYVYRKDQSGGEGTWGDRITLHRLYRAPDGTLVRSIRESYQQRSIFTLGGAVGPPKTVDVEYRFSPASRSQ